MPVVVLYHIVDSAVRSRKPIRIIQMEKAPEGGGGGDNGGSSETKVSQNNCHLTITLNYAIETCYKTERSKFRLIM